MSYTNVEQFLASIVAVFQTTEDTLQQMIVGLTIDDAIGVQLDMLGDLVGRPRNGVTDDEIYRRMIRAQTVTNNSDGVMEDLIKVADLIVYDVNAVYRINNHGVAALTMTLEGVIVSLELAQLLLTFLRRAVSGGVRLVLEYWPVDESEMFSFESFVPGGGTGKGWGSSLDADVGGVLAGAVE